ncbi:MAG: zinc-binding dehydrogenase, partial [Caldilineaceae bacterium]|nr:zinc-binding dehydrogenase [Caldilineaceae bacterium]
IPVCGPRDVLVKNQVSLISRGSEVLRRYMHQEAIDPAIMGYSVAGVVEAVGAEAAARFQPGDRVAAVAPHAQYVLLSIDAMEGSAVWPIPDDITFEQAAFLPLVTGGVTWANVPGIRPSDTVVVLGQGLVGNLVMQAARQYLLEKLIAVDTIAARCDLAEQLGAHRAINASQQDPVAVVRELTGGKGADLVFDCVGGKPGLTSFAQAQEMVCNEGTLHLIGLYHGAPLLLDASKIQRKRLIGGYYAAESRPVMLTRSIELLQARRIQIEPLISHRFPFTEAKAAYDLLYDRLSEAMGVLLIWS